MSRWHAARRAGEPARRWDPGRGGLLAIAAVAVVVTVVVGGLMLASRPHRIPTAQAVSLPSVPEAMAPSSPGPGRASPAAARTSAAGPVVDVAGKVRRPGMYRLAEGARVQDAVTAAGGMLPGVDPVTVNLARKVADGEQVVIGVAAGVAAVGASGTAPAGGPTGPIDLNTATAEQLDALPGVGPVLAQHIVDWRTQHGRFDSVGQLNDVSGIGDSKFADLRPLVTVS